MLLLDICGRETQLLPILMGDSLTHGLYSTVLGIEGHGHISVRGHCPPEEWAGKPEGQCLRVSFVMKRHNS